MIKAPSTAKYLVLLVTSTHSQFYSYSLRSQQRHKLYRRFRARLSRGIEHGDIGKLSIVTGIVDPHQLPDSLSQRNGNQKTRGCAKQGQNGIEGDSSSDCSRIRRASTE